jgi:hypothetical protein
MNSPRYIRIEYGWNNGSKFLSDSQRAEFRKLLAQLRKIGFKSERYNWSTDLLIEESALGFNDTVRVLYIYNEMRRLMKVAETEYRRRCATHTRPQIVMVYGDVCINGPRMTGLESDVQTYLSSLIKR